VIIAKSGTELCGVKLKRFIYETRLRKSDFVIFINNKRVTEKEGVREIEKEGD